ncbi:hypothetical protein PENARI_c008G02497 [Penicillium arizonense]|uniref:Uncharacterized protein n=1 Tax=Penicillium arizonense TaxID=1835702 RepID=A0A1F5LJS1_PENAI|nr:hypothetical protein PENARI_c008G02497 [Penicillium arizonense]OGE53346.1 hypothetical protein PENARI_c008G02497 [Penicillium arizonense]
METLSAAPDNNNKIVVVEASFNMESVSTRLQATPVHTGICRNTIDS